MGKKLQTMQPVLSCKKEERSCSSSKGLSSVFDLWQNCSNQRLKLVLGLEHPKRNLTDKMESKKLEVDDGKRTVKALMDEESFKEQSKPVLRVFSKRKQKGEKQKSNLSKENKEAEAFVNKALKRYLYKDRRNYHPQYFLDALTILKSNEDLGSKLIQDPNSLLSKHIRNIQELHVEKERSKLVTKSKFSEEELDTMKFQKKNMYHLVWGKFKTRYEYPSGLRKNPRALKQVEISENLGCHCSSILKSRNNVVEPLYFSFKTKSKFTKGDERKELKGSFKSNISSIDANIRRSFDSSLVKYSEGDFDIVEEEGKRHLSEMLMNSNRNKCDSNVGSPKILGKILHLPRSQIFDSELDILRNRLLDTKRHEGIFPEADGFSSADQIGNDLSQSEDFNVLEFPTSPSSPNDTIAEQNIVSISSSENTEELECSGKVSTFQYQQLIAPPDYSSIKTEIGNLPSPVSVLDPLFLDDNSPSSTTDQQGNPPIQPMHIDFEQYSVIGSSPSLEMKSESSINELDLISIYIEALLQTNSSSWDELFLSWQSYSSNQFFNPNLINEVKLPLTEFHDPNIFFDSVNEAISEVYHCYFKSSPFVSAFLLKPVPTETSVVNEIKKKVDVYFCPRVQPRTIEQLAGEDHVRLHTWMDIREDIEEIVVQVVESVMEKLIQEIEFEILF